MKYPIILTITLMTIGLVMAAPAGAFDKRNAIEAGDGHWIYFGPDPSSDWTAPRPMPLKRSLEGSIRQDALRHYEMPRFELPESGEVISFYGGTKDVQAETRPVPVMRTPEDPQWEIFELPESGNTIRFARDMPLPAVDETFVAGQNESPS